MRLEPAVEHQKELVGIFVDVPHMLALGVGDPYVVLVHSGDDPGTVDVVEPRKGLTEIDALGSHRVIVIGPALLRR
jgi:hypothetical protein